MRPTLPDLNATLSPEEAQKLRGYAMVHCLNAKADWMERTLGPLLPPEIYRMVHDQSGGPKDFEQRKEIVNKYLESQDIRLCEHGMNAAVFKGRNWIHRFFVHQSEK